MRGGASGILRVMPSSTLKPRSRSPRAAAVLAIFAALALVGLVFFAIWTVWSNAQLEHDRTRLQSLENARLAVAELRARFRQPSVLDAIPESARFNWRGGRLVVPPEVRWLRPPERVSREDLDVLVQQRLLRGDAAAAILRDIRDEIVLPRAHRDWLRAHGAWEAHRASQRVERDRLLAKLDEAQGASVPVSALLLHAQVSGRLPSWAEARLPALPREEAGFVFERLDEVARTAPRIARSLPAMRERHATLRARRALLLDIDAHLRARPRPQRGAAVFEALGARALVLHVVDADAAASAKAQASGGLLDLPALRATVRALQKETATTLQLFRQGSQNASSLRRMRRLKASQCSKEAFTSRRRKSGSKTTARAPGHSRSRRSRSRSSPLSASVSTYVPCAAKRRPRARAASF